MYRFFFLLLQNTIELMHVYATLFCVCILAQDILNSKAHRQRPKKWQTEEAGKKNMKKKSYVKRNRNLALDINRQQFSGPYIFYVCVLVDYKTFYGGKKTFAYSYADSLDLFRLVIFFFRLHTTNIKRKCFHFSIEAKGIFF